MRVLPAFLGGLALFASAYPVVDVAEKPENTTLAILEQDIALPSQFLPISTAVAVLTSDDVEGVQNDLVKRKGVKVKKPKTTKPKTTKPKTTKPKTTKPKTTKPKTTKPKTTKPKTTKPKTTKTKSPHATKTKSPNATKTKTPKTTKTKSHATTATSSGAAQCPARFQAKKGLCGPDSPCASSGKTTTTKKKTKVTRALELVQTLKRSVQEAPSDLARLFKRVDALHLSATEIATARAKGRTQTSAKKSGTYRYLHHGNQEDKPLKLKKDQPYTLPMTPNDASFDAFGSEAFFRNFDSLRGCTGVMVVSNKGIYSAHLWQTLLEEPARLQEVLRNLVKGDADKHETMSLGGSKKIKVYTSHNQLGLKDVPSGTWSDLAYVKVAIFTPSSGKTNVQGIENAIKQAIPNLRSDNIVVKKYTNSKSTDKVDAAGTQGTMTAYYDGKGRVGVYGETEMILDLNLAQKSQDCLNDACVVQK